MTSVTGLDEAISLLLSGAVGVLPTDTVYGLVARAHDQQAVTRLYALKNRECKPGTIIAASAEQLIELGFDAHMLQKASQFWPASLSIVVPTSHKIAYLDQEVGSQPMRVPADKNIRAMLERTGPLVTSSANHPGKPTAETIEDAYNYFKERVDFYVDGGNLGFRPPSTIIRFSDTGTFEILREGAVKITPPSTL